MSEEDTFRTTFSTGQGVTYGTTATAASSGSLTLTIDGSDSTLRNQIIQLEQTIERQQQVIGRLNLQIEHLIEDLKTQEELESDVGFTKEELAFILSRVHPDKNPDSEMAHKLTTKLIKGRKK